MIADAHVQRVGLENARAGNEKERIAAKADHRRVSLLLRPASAPRLGLRVGDWPWRRRR